MKPKLKDVASLAGVSLTTASLVFSGQGRISEETRVKVLNSANSLGYTKKKKDVPINDFSNIGILYSIDSEWAFAMAFIQPIIAEIERELKKIDLNTLLIPIHHGIEDDEILKKIYSIKCKAVISIHFGKESLFTHLENTGIPVIIVMNNNYQSKFYSVCVDDFQGAYEGTMHLLELGHSKILFLDYLRPDLPLLSTDRFIGFKKALDERNIAFPESNRFFYDPENRDQCRKDLSEFFNKEQTPTAIFCLDDDIAARTIQVLINLGLRVPEEVSVVAPGDLLDYTMSYLPRITTMHIDTTYMGRITAQMLVNRLTHNPEAVHVLKVKQQLVKRGSCRSIRS